MRRLASPVPRSPVRAIWLGRAALAMVFAGFFIGGAVSASEALVMTGLFALLAFAAWGGVGGPVPLRRLAWPAAAFFVVLCVGVATVIPMTDPSVRVGLYRAVGGHSLSIAPVHTLVEIAKLLGLACAFLTGVYAISGFRAGIKLLDAFIAGTAVWTGWSLILYVLEGGQARLGAPFLSPNTAATVVGVGAVVTAGRILGVKSVRLRAGGRWTLAVQGGALLLMILALVLTQSRSGLAVVTLSLLGLYLSWPRPTEERARSRLWLGGAGLIVLAFALIEAGDGVMGRLGGIGGAAADRAAIYKIYASAFRDAPLFGAGLGTGSLVTKLGLTPQTYEALWNIQSAHNWALQWLAEGGLAAALPMGAAIGACLLTAIRGLDARSAPLLLPLLFADSVILLHGMTDFALQIPAVALCWSFLLGVQVAIAERPFRKRKLRRRRRDGLAHADTV